MGLSFLNKKSWHPTTVSVITNISFLTIVFALECIISLAGGAKK